MGLRAKPKSESKKKAKPTTPFGSKAYKLDDEAKALQFRSANPYAHVDDGSGQVARPVDFTKDPDKTAEEKEAAPQFASKSVAHGDPLAEAYSLLRKHRAIRFGAQRSDGSWEVAPVVSQRIVLTQEQMLQVQELASRVQADPKLMGTFNAPTQNLVALELQRRSALQRS